MRRRRRTICHETEVAQEPAAAVDAACALLCWHVEPQPWQAALQLERRVHTCAHAEAAALSRSSWPWGNPKNVHAAAAAETVEGWPL